MRPILFKEQFSGSNNPPPAPISLVDYKINYNDRLGSGVFGDVFGLTKRPAHDKTFFSKWFPFVYDYFYPLPDDEIEPAPWCIKIFKSNPHMMPQELDKPPEAFLEYESHLNLRRYRMTQMEFATATDTAQIKTRIQGKTLKQLLDERAFSKPSHYLLRRAYLFFLWGSQQVPLAYEDLHFDNLMYDENTHQIEIVDGNVSALEKNTQEPHIIKPTQCDAYQQRILSELETLAKSGIPYTPSRDSQLLFQAKPRAQEFHNLSIKSNLRPLPLPNPIKSFTI